MSHLIQEFFAVTSTSVYAVRRYNNDVSVVKTYALPGANGNVQINQSIEAQTLWAITCKRGIFPYCEALCGGKVGKNCPQPEDVPVMIRNMSAGTSMVFALFLDEQTAKNCLASRPITLLSHQWFQYTKEALHAIGDDPVIKVSRDPVIGFPKEFFQE